MRVFRLLIYQLLFAVVAFAAAVGPPRDNPVEIGLVQWQRDFPAGLAAAGQTGKPVLLLFQEVPGCIGCQTFGQQVLSHPLIVEAIEDNFIPILVYNNRSTGMDKELLDRFSEPSWNFQVMRFLDERGRDLIPRRDEVWTLAETAQRMIAGLEASNRPVPPYLRNLALEEDGDNLRQLAFSMFCFWTGEYTLGGFDGVVATEAGYYREKEVTLVTYHQGRLSRDNLIRLAAQHQCATTVYGLPGEDLDSHGLAKEEWQGGEYRRAPEEDQKKQLQGRLALGNLESLTPMQLTKLNAFWPDDETAALAYLSQRQRRALGVPE